MNEEQQQENLLANDFDGIRELDNRLPPWWVNLFYVTIVFSFFYISGYHVFGWFELQDAEYQREQQKYALLKPAAPAKVTLARLTDPARLAKGKVTFGTYCASCHGPEGQGIIGPNFTDEYWLNIKSFDQMPGFIAEGLPAKGMPPWKLTLKPDDILDVASYIATLQGSTPANPKAPQGEKLGALP